MQSIGTGDSTYTYLELVKKNILNPYNILKIKFEKTYLK